MDDSSAKFNGRVWGCWLATLAILGVLGGCAAADGRGLLLARRR
jgi:hypothetical protein